MMPSWDFGLQQFPQGLELPMPKTERPMTPKMTTPNQDPMRYDVSLLTDFDLHLFNEGNHARLYQKLGAHPMTVGGEQGTLFAVWAPNAENVSVIGEFNHWNKTAHPLQSRGESGIWEGFVPGVGTGTQYKYYVSSQHHGYRVDKADPFAFYNQVPPETASIVSNLSYSW